MKYCEITARINTFFEKDDDAAKIVYADKEVLNEKVKDASEFIDKQEKESGSNIVMSRGIIGRRMRTYGTIFNFFKTANEMFDSYNSEESSAVVEHISGHNIILIAKFLNDDNEKELKVIENKIKNFINQNYKDLLVTRNVSGEGLRRCEEKEYYVGVEITHKDISFKDFYFNGISTAWNNGLDIENYFQTINENSSFVNSYFYDNVDKYLLEYDIPIKTSKKYFYKKHKELLMNKSFKSEIDRIFAVKNEYNVKINPVHYEINEYVEF